MSGRQKTVEAKLRGPFLNQRLALDWIKQSIMVELQTKELMRKGDLCVLVFRPESGYCWELWAHVKRAGTTNFTVVRNATELGDLPFSR